MFFALCSSQEMARVVPPLELPDRESDRKLPPFPAGSCGPLEVQEVPGPHPGHWSGDRSSVAAGKADYLSVVIMIDHFGPAGRLVFLNLAPNIGYLICEAFQMGLDAGQVGLDVHGRVLTAIRSNSAT